MQCTLSLHCWPSPAGLGQVPIVCNGTREMPLQLLRTTHRVSVLLTMPHDSPPFAAATISQRGGDANPLHPTPCLKSHALLSPSHDPPGPSGVAHVLLTALQ